jgi:hypothetical protein
MRLETRSNRSTNLCGIPVELHGTLGLETSRYQRSIRLDDGHRAGAVIIGALNMLVVRNYPGKRRSHAPGAGRKGHRLVLDRYQYSPPRSVKCNITYPGVLQ